MLTLAAADTIAGVAGTASKITCTIFGMELASGTETYKVLYQGQLAAAAATIYTVPGSTTAFVRSISVVNTDNAVSQTFQLLRGGTAASNAITPVIQILPAGMGFYEDGKGWQFTNSTGQVMTTEGYPVPATNNMGIAGTLAESIDRNVCVETNATIPTASGTLFMQAIYLTAGMTVTNISWCSATTAAGTPTHWMFGLFDGSRNLLASTADQTSTAWAANTVKTVGVTTPYVTTSTGLYYVGMFMTATTIITSKGNTAKTNGALAATAPILHGTSSTGLTTSMPNPAAAITAGLVNAWCAVS